MHTMRRVDPLRFRLHLRPRHHLRSSLLPRLLPRLRLRLRVRLHLHLCWSSTFHPHTSTSASASPPTSAQRRPSARLRGTPFTSLFRSHTSEHLSPGHAPLPHPPHPPTRRAQLCRLFPTSTADAAPKSPLELTSHLQIATGYAVRTPCRGNEEDGLRNLHLRRGECDVGVFIIHDPTPSCTGTTQRHLHSPSIPVTRLVCMIPPRGLSVGHAPVFVFLSLSAFGVRIGVCVFVRVSVRVRFRVRFFRYQN